MKGVSVQQLRTLVQTVLGKAAQLLDSEPARVIGYGAAVVVYLVARVMADRGYLAIPLTFDESIGAAFAAITTLVIVIEAIRRFVYSPLTYIEDLADEAVNAHIAGHEAGHDHAEMEQAVRAFVEHAEAAAEEETIKVPVGSPKAAGAGDRKN